MENAKELIIGFKPSGHDSAVFIVDPNNKKVLGISMERITRIKHDSASILTQLGNTIFEHFNLDKDSKIYLAESFTDFTLSSIISNILRYEIYKTFEIRYIKDFDKYFKKDTKERYLLLLKRNPVLFLKLAINQTLISKLPKNMKKSFIKFYVGNKLKNKNIDYVEYDHQLCHAASAYYFSPFDKNEKVVIVTMDGMGDRNCFSSVYLGENNKLKKITESYAKKVDKNLSQNVTTGRLWYSIGNLYGIFTHVLGFKINSDEGKTEALAAYAKNPKNEIYEDLMKCYTVNDKLQIIPNYERLKKYFNINYLNDLKNKMGEENFAGAIQKFLEDFMVEYIKKIIEKTGIKTFCFAGGVFANVIMNLRIWEDSGIERMYIFPAMGDDGTAAGAAVLRAIELGYDVSWLKDLEMPYWGPSYSKEDVEKELKKDKWKDKITYEYIGDKWPEMAAEMIAKGKIIAIYQGRMEFGPRALGNRSILADPRDPKTRDKINSTVKRRPWFQPFCPSVLEEERERLFEKSYKHKHMAIAFRMKKEYWDKLPSAMHIDGTARPQFVEKSDNPNYYRLIKRFKELTGYGIVVNTSFNLHGRTIVRTPEDAITDFIDCNIDAMFIEGFLVRRTKNGVDNE